MPFLGYVLGMGAVLIGVALAAGVLLGSLRAISRRVDELGSIALMAVGGHMVLYWLPRPATGP